MPGDAYQGNLIGTLRDIFSLGLAEEVSIRRDPTTGKLYLKDPVSGEIVFDEVWMGKHIQEVQDGETYHVAEGRQLLNEGDFYLDGELILDGDLHLI